MSEKRRLRISANANHDIVAILNWTRENFGDPMAAKYAILLRTAIKEIAAHPELAGSNAREDLAEACRSYHLFFSRKKAVRLGGAVRQPRHLIIYRFETEHVDLLRIVHDSMDPRRDLFGEE